MPFQISKPHLEVNVQNKKTVMHAFVHYFTNLSKILRLDVFFMLYPYNKTKNHLGKTVPITL